MSKAFDYVLYQTRCSWKLILLQYCSYEWEWVISSIC